jgi:hypothetical protein
MYSKRLSPKMDAQKTATETVATEGNRTFLVAHREDSGQAEWHEKQADIMVIQTGVVTMIYGGEVLDGENEQPGEIRGSGIKGGTEI